MSDVETLLQQALRASTDGRSDEALSLASRAVALAREPSSTFEALLHRARAEYAAGNVQRALDTYWEARNLTKKHRLGRSGEADLGIGMTLLDLGRGGEGLEAVRRAGRQFRKAGQPFLRGCAETVLADEAIRAGDLALAERHLEVAADLLQTSAEPRILSGTLTVRAEVLARRGKRSEATSVLAKAERVAKQVRNPAIIAELRARRRAVLDILAGPEDE